MAEASKDDLEKVETRIVNLVKDGFSTVNRRLDVMDDRMGESETARAKHETKVENLEREVFSGKRRGSKSGNDSNDSSEPGNSRLTMRDAMMFGVGGGLVWGVIQAARALFAVIANGKP